MTKKKNFIIGLALLASLILGNMAFAAAPTISNLDAPNSELRPTTALITWTTDIPTDSIVMFGEFSASLTWEGVDTSSTDHSVQLKNLKPFTTYQYYVNAKNAEGQITKSDTKEFTTTILTNSIVGLDVPASTIRPDNVTVTWDTTNDSDSIVYYRESGLTSWSWQGDDKLISRHSVIIPNLKPFTTYQYYVNAKDLNSNMVKSDTKEFTTTIKTVTPDPLTFSNIKSEVKENKVTISWSTNYPSNSSVHYFYPNSNTKEYDNYNWDKADDFTQTHHSVDLTNLKSGVKYYYSVESKRKDDYALTKSADVFEFIAPRSNSIMATDNQLSDINNRARNLNDGKLSELLAEIKLLRDQLREQAAELKYLKTFTTEMKALNANMQSAIKAFIAYGVDDNTKKLGEGERAAVINSFKTAFDKLPETEAELADVIKIANGRWPSATNDVAEKKANEQFQKIYKRIADMNDPKDNAAITVMAYGLRQRAENRNLNSEKQGIQIFKGIYGHVPASTEDWNTMQAITYSGASRGVDTDGDLLVDSREQELGTDPKNKDTDGDGHIDGVEVANGFDPLKK